MYKHLISYRYLTLTMFRYNYLTVNPENKLLSAKTRVQRKSSEDMTVKDKYDAKISERMKLKVKNWLKLRQ